MAPGQPDSASPQARKVGVYVRPSVGAPARGGAVRARGPSNQYGQAIRCPHPVFASPEGWRGWFASEVVSAPNSPGDSGRRSRPRISDPGFPCSHPPCLRAGCSVLQPSAPSLFSRDGLVAQVGGAPAGGLLKARQAGTHPNELVVLAVMQVRKQNLASVSIVVPVRLLANTRSSTTGQRRGNGSKLEILHVGVGHRLRGLYAFRGCAADLARISRTPI